MPSPRERKAPAGLSFKLAVAKHDIESGTAIDDPEKFFQVKTFTEAPEKAIAFDDIASLKGKTIKHTLFKDGVATGKYFEGEIKAAVAAKPAEPAVKKHTMFIQNGGAAPVATVFHNGVANIPPAQGAPVQPEVVPAPEPATPAPTADRSSK